MLGEKHSDYALRLVNLAHLYHSQGNYAKAEPLYRRALEIYKELLGEEHLQYATSLHSLAVLYTSQGNYAKARAFHCYGQALEIYKKVLGEKNPEYALGLSNLATLYFSQRNYAKAEPLHRQALEIRKGSLSREKHADYAASLNNLAQNYITCKGATAKAEPFGTARPWKSTRRCWERNIPIMSRVCAVLP